uniref:Uncharacterized protein n=1 Tax=Anguilla anguilla TaxID=7936 RepID=A0A0E9STR3_ANGAN
MVRQFVNTWKAELCEMGQCCYT